jgi:hypothetical protein
MSPRPSSQATYTCAPATASWTWAGRARSPVAIGWAEKLFPPSVEWA